MSAHRPTRSQVLAAAITESVLHARLSWREYAQNVADHYLANTAVHDRVISFRVATTADEYEEVAQLNTQTVRRMVSGEKVIPLDVSESLVEALPEPYRERTLALLASRFGLMAARKPPAPDVPGGQYIGPCRLMRDTAAVLEPLARALEDNRLTPEDLPAINEALRSVSTLMATCIQVEAQLQQAMETMGKGVAA
ncbi:hypothetical protein EIM50_13615 [Pseudoxanthomonas sp. SGD-10]|nr:hypothetical protein EIM50_13615 [Pseudoxanthomonas sp. SGD-10]